MAQTFGYARVSTLAQNLDAPVGALVRAGVDERCVVVEHGSGRRDDRPELGRLIASLRTGNPLVVTKLDRLGRSAVRVAQLVADLVPRDVALRSISETIGTTIAAGRLVVHVLAAVAQMEADHIRERTLDGPAAARVRGRVGVCPTVMTPERVDAARAALAQDTSRTTVAKATGVSRDTLYRHPDRLSMP